MRYAILKYSADNVASFLQVLGIEAQEIAILSPLVHQVLRKLDHWMELILTELNSFESPPEDFIPGCNLNSMTGFTGPNVLKYKAMFDPANTPFM
jgi:hypothetical protein